MGIRWRLPVIPTKMNITMSTGTTTTGRTAIVITSRPFTIRGEAGTMGTTRFTTIPSTLATTTRSSTDPGLGGALGTTHPITIIIPGPIIIPTTGTGTTAVTTMLMQQGSEAGCCVGTI